MTYTPIDQQTTEADVLSLLSLSDTDDAALLSRVSSIVSGVVSALSLRLGGRAVPEVLGYVVRDVSLARYNRLGSEGVSSHGVEGETMQWNRGDDFAPYAADIAAWGALADEPAGAGGVVRFL